MTVYLGVDAGGSKTAFVVIDGGETVLADATGPGAYYLADGMAAVQRVLEDGVAEVLGRAGVAPDSVDRAFFALPAYGESSADVPRLDALPHAVLGHDRYSCGNDMVAGWAGSLAGEDGVNVVAGTGSIAYGERDGRAARAGGWGELFGDEGSGYWIAVQGLRAFSRMADGRAPVGPLRAVLREALDIDADLDAIGEVLAGGRRDRVAALSRVVTAAADDGDAAALDIVARAGAELAGLAVAVRDAIGAGSGATPLSYSGGMFTAPRVLAAFTDALGDGWDLREPRFGPAIGAALYAKKQAEHA